MAEGVGFEPTVALRLLLISSQVPLTTQPPFPPLVSQVYAPLQPAASMIDVQTRAGGSEIFSNKPHFNFFKTPSFRFRNHEKNKNKRQRAAHGVKQKRQRRAYMRIFI